MNDKRIDLGNRVDGREGCRAHQRKRVNVDDAYQHHFASLCMSAVPLPRDARLPYCR